MPLVFEGAITDFAEAVEKHRSCQRVPGFALVEAGSCAPPQCGIFEPRQHEEGPFNSSDLAQRERKTVPKLSEKLDPDKTSAFKIVLAPSRSTSETSSIARGRITDPAGNPVHDAIVQPIGLILGNPACTEPSMAWIH
jgi:hypothetical protein